MAVRATYNHGKTPGRRPPAPVRSELGSALAACRSALVSVGLFSGMSNILMLTGSFFMLEVYDRVLPSRSIPTLVVLLHSRRRALRRARRSRPDPRPHPGAHRQQPRRGGERTRLRRHRAHSAQGRQPRRPAAAAARSRRRARLPVGRRPDRVVRPAVDADLSRDLLCVPFLHRRHRAGRHDHPGRADSADRSVHAPSEQGGGGDVQARAIRSPRRAAATPRR